MAAHSSILARRLPRTEEPGGLQSTGLHESKSQTQRSTHVSRVSSAFVGPRRDGSCFFPVNLSYVSLTVRLAKESRRARKDFSPQ